MQASARKDKPSGEIGEVYGSRVRLSDRDEHFKRDWKSVELVIEGHIHTFALPPRFWNTCPELRDTAQAQAIRHWLIQHHTLVWRRGSPPQVELLPLGSARFALL
jgi:hypothetical protein